MNSFKDIAYQILKEAREPLPKQKEMAKKAGKMRQEISETRNRAKTILETAKNKISEILKA